MKTILIHQRNLTLTK